jgi:HAD superfamily hydrolase (TIGR01549 family)
MTRDPRRPRFDGREIDAVLIDAGGVLVEPNWATVASVLEKRGVHADEADLAAANPFLMRELDDADLISGSTDVTRRQRWLARLLHHADVAGDAEAIEVATDELEALHLERGIWESILDGAPAALDTLRDAGLRLALVSNAEPLLRRKLAELGLADRFDHLAISGELGVEKPDPRIFRDALDALGTSVDRAIHVGDLYEVDVVGARRIGMAAVLVDVADLSGERDVTRIRSLRELPALLGIGS